MKKEEKKEITASTATRAIITGYIAYGILMGFIAFILGIVVNWCLSVIPTVNHRVVSITVPLIGAILLYFVLHAICRLSIYDVFRKCKTNPDNLQKICSRMNLFVIICVAFFVVSIIGMLMLNFANQEKAITVATYQYSSIHSEEFTKSLTNEMMQEFNETKANMIISTVIMELGLVVAWFSVIPLQKKFIEKYNEF